MKKNFLKFFLTTGVFLSLGGLVSSCTGDDTEKTGNGPNGPGGDDGKNTYVTTEGPTPIRYVESKYIATENGVSIDATGVTADNLKFTCKVGSADIQSYRLQIYPLSSVYNTLINLMTSSKQESLTTTQTEETIVQMLNNSESTTSGGKLINKEGFGEDFGTYEFDYMNSDFQVFTIQPDVDYLIVVQAFFDEKGSSASAGDLGICHVRTPKKEIVGNPEIAFAVQLDYTGYRVTHIPNDDCKYFYYLSSFKSDIQQYIDSYGEEMYRQLLCHYGDRVDVATGELAFEATEQNPDLDYVTTAVALDANGTAVNKVFRKDFRLPVIPSETEKAEYQIFAPDRIGGSIVEFDVRLEKNCQKIRHQLLHKARAEAIMSGDEASRQQYAQALFDNPNKDNPSWVIENENYSFDRENNACTGDAFDTRNYEWELQGDTEYVLVYAGVNYYNQVGPLKATEPFRTKPLVRDNPAACQSDFEMKVIATDRESVTLQFSYDSNNTALYYFSYYKPDPSDNEDGTENGWFVTPDVKDGSDDARYGTGKYAGVKDSQGNQISWLYCFLEYRDTSYELPWPNMWYAEGKGQHVETYQWSGFDADKTFEFAYMAEDWNGVLSPVGFCTGITPEIIGGDNPTVALAADRLPDGTYALTFSCNSDSRQMLYMTASINDTDVATALALASLRDKDPSLAYEDYVEAWEEYVLANGLQTTVTNITSTLIPSGAISVAMAISIGGAEAGNPVYSKLATLVFNDGKVMTLEEYLGVKSASSSVKPKVPAPAIQPNGRGRMMRTR